MSYCDGSSADFQCDLYCYESCEGGYVTHLAANRLVFGTPLPEPAPLGAEHTGRRLARHQKVRDLARNAARVPIDLPFAGETFRDSTLEDLYARLTFLHSLGYRFPDSVLDAVREDMAEGGGDD